MGERQQLLAEALLADEGVVSLSSFIGVDGTNPSLNSGRMFINLPPHSERSESVFTVIDRLRDRATERSEEHTSELQSRPHLVCRLLLEKKNQSTYESLA